MDSTRWSVYEGEMDRDCNAWILRIREDIFVVIILSGFAYNRVVVNRIERLKSNKVAHHVERSCLVIRKDEKAGHCNEVGNHDFHDQQVHNHNVDGCKRIC